MLNTKISHYPSSIKMTAHLPETRWMPLVEAGIAPAFLRVAALLAALALRICMEACILEATRCLIGSEKKDHFGGSHPPCSWPVGSWRVEPRFAKMCVDTAC